MDNSDEKPDIIAVEDARIKFAKVHRPERTRTIQTIETTGSRRPSLSTPKRPLRKDKAEKKNVDIVKYINHKHKHLPINLSS